jgi:hypothetical protein
VVLKSFSSVRRTVRVVFVGNDGHPTAYQSDDGLGTVETAHRVIPGGAQIVLEEVEAWPSADDEPEAGPVRFNAAMPTAPWSRPIEQATLLMVGSLYERRATR